jgi:hypothetical protein
VKERIRNLDAEIKIVRERLIEARKAVKITEHTHADRLDQLLLTITRLHFADEDERYLLRARIAQELRRIIDRVVLNRDREITVVLKPAAGCTAEMEFRNGRFEMLRLTDLATEEVIQVDRLSFLLMQYDALSTKRLS